MADPRLEPFERKDGYAKATLVKPDLDSDTGWLCPGCGANTTVFYGHGPEFKNGKYVKGTDTRLCLDCWGKGG